MPANKAEKKKPQLKNIDDLFGLDGNEAIGKLNVQDIPVNNLTPYVGHLYKLYEGERLEDMVDSVRKNGVLIPVIARKKAGDVIEILTGHNRTNAAKLAGLETVPTIVLEDISDEEADTYVNETNLMQRSFKDMSHSEKADVIAMRNSKMFSQGKRNDILEQLKAIENPELAEKHTKTTAKTSTSSHDGTELDSEANQPRKGKRTDEKIGEMYSLSRNTVARYLRISQLNKALKMMLDSNRFTFLVAVELSFLNKEEQDWLVDLLDEGLSVNTAKAAALREHAKKGMLDYVSMNEILAGHTTTEIKPRRVNINGDFYGKYFKPEQSAKEVESIVEEALKLYFDNRRGLAE